MEFVTDALPQLQNLTLAPASSQARSIYLGGQDFNHCCLLALNHSFDISNGNLSFSQPSYVSLATVDSFTAAVAQGQFPCGAVYSPNSSGAPVVQAPYNWCADTCGGWQISHHDALSQWIGPMVGFILPCIAFCLNIPRSSKLSIPSWIFQPSPNRTMGLLYSISRFPPALFLVTIDTIIWLSLCFAFAGPMLLSAIYEAYLDNQLLTILDQKIRIESQRIPNLTEGMRARLLSIIVVGNLKMKNSGHVSEVESLNGNFGPGFPMVDTTTVKARLQALLASQSSFGSAVGAPVVFFVGAFIYNLIDIRSKLGDNDTSHALAFGMWWMTIPELAIVSCLLLAANNPAALHGVLGRSIESEGHDEKRHVFRWKPLSILGWQPLEDAYGGRYKPVNLWHRGVTKYKWFRRVIEMYTHDHSLTPDQHLQIAQIDSALRMTLSDWIKTWCGALLLLLVPCLLSFLTSYNTPRIGLACRSLTQALYIVTEVVLMTIWLVHTMLEAQVAQKGELSTRETRRFQRRQGFIKFVLWTVGSIMGTAAVFTSIGGTLMQLIGVYRNCLCHIPIQYWLRKDDPGAYVILSTNSAEDIQAAMTWWQGTAIAAIAVLCAVCGFGWGHQRRLRKLFEDLVDLIDKRPSFYDRNIASNMRS